MKRLALIGALLLSASAVVPGARVAVAADGRVAFSGAVVAPTCVPSAAPAARDRGDARALRCAGDRRVPGARMSSQTVDRHTAAGNPLLRYYLRTREPAAPASARAARMVTVQYP
jgi:hypothetical protein